MLLLQVISIIDIVNLISESQCPNPRCESVPALLHVVPQRQRDTSETSVLVSAAAYVLEPGEKPGELNDGVIYLIGVSGY